MTFLTRARAFNICMYVIELNLPFLLMCRHVNLYHISYTATVQLGTGNVQYLFPLLTSLSTCT